MTNENRLMRIDDFLALVKKNAPYLYHMIAPIVILCPTVDAVEVVHGEWEMGLDEGDYDYGTCSVCGYNEYNAFCCLLPHNYCPNCGAKMDGGNEDENDHCDH